MYGPRPKTTTWHQTGSAAGGWSGFLRTTDWYNTSEANFNVLWTKTYMCQISTQDGLRDIVRICDSPDPDATFSKKFTQPLVGPSESGSGAGRSNKLFLRDEVWMYLDKSILPIVIDSFSADGKQAYANCGVVGNFADASYTAPAPDAHGNKLLSVDGDYIDDQFHAPAFDREGKLVANTTVPVVIYPCTFVRVALNPNCYGAIVGALDTYTNAQGKVRASAKLIATFPKNYLDQYPNTTYLRLQKRMVHSAREVYVDYIPANPIKGSPANPACDQFGKVHYLLEDLDLDAHYTAWVIDITAYPYDSSTIREKKANLKTLTNDEVYFNKLRSMTVGNGGPPNNATSTDIDECMYYWNAAILTQPTKLTTFSTPPSPNSNQDIPFMAGSCFAGTLGAYEGAHKIEHLFNALVGDVSYNDNCRGSKADFMHNYLAWLKNENGQRTLISKALYTLRDDHENLDNWYANIFISAFNTPKYRLDNGAWGGPENALYDAIAANPQTAAKIMFRRTNQFAMALSPSDRIKNAIDANNASWPTLPAHDVTPNGCFAVRWGKMLAIFLNVNADQNEDGSTNYHIVEGTASADNTTFVALGGNYLIPPQSMQFLKSKLQTSNADANVVFFSKDIGCLFNNRYSFLKSQFTAIANQVSPGVSQSVVDSLHDRLFNAFNFNNSDGYHTEISDLVDWMKQKRLKNVFFITGDPHSSLVKYLDERNVYVSCCISAVSTYRSSGSNLMFAPNIDSDKTILALSNNAYADFLFSPSRRTMKIVLRYADEVRAEAEIDLARGNGWGPI